MMNLIYGVIMMMKSERKQLPKVRDSLDYCLINDFSMFIDRNECANSRNCFHVKIGFIRFKFESLKLFEICKFNFRFHDRTKHDIDFDQFAVAALTSHTSQQFERFQSANKRGNFSLRQLQLV